ncbi:MAG TPA: outer membrane protein transport protein [Polyangiaceae bacterium]|nr:outer membrane protein transport protein [Polyangiaceae bacterium]
MKPGWLAPTASSWLSWAAALGVALAPVPAVAAGFDTPILYTARHQAMGGTAIASVDDVSAGFHNPAGLQGVHGLGVMGDFSLLLGKLKSTPDPSSGNVESKTVVAPFFLLGGAYRIHEWLTLGLAGFPVASGGAEYRYVLGTTPTIDKTEIVFFETTPMLSFNVPKDRLIPGTLAIGAGYRVSYVRFDRLKGAVDNPQYLDLKLRGFNWTGFRIGAQYRPIDALRLGVVFRNKVVVKTTAKSGTVLAGPATDGELEFTLPAKVGFGARVDVGQVGIGSDLEWAFQSQNKEPRLKGDLPSGHLELPNKFDWQNGLTWRFGAEYRLGIVPMVPLRAGYIYDSKVTNPAFPSAFGTPPAPTHTVTAGTGYVEEHWQANVAVSHRFGKTHINDTDLGSGCVFCSLAGDYSIAMTGIYVDLSFDMGL